MQKNKFPPAVVLGLNPNSLGIIKALTRMGIQVSAIDKTPKGIDDTHRWMSSKTNLCQHKLFYDGDNQELLETLLNLSSVLSEKAAIIPSGDNEVLFLSEYQAQLREHFYFNVPEQETLDLLENKGLFYQYAENKQVPIPKSFYQLRPDEIDKKSKQLRFPVLLKPHFRDYRWDKEFNNKKVLIFETHAELLERYQGIYDFHPDLVLQEVIPGDDKELYFCEIYIDKDNQVQGIWTGHKLRQYPVHYGTSTMAESIWIEEIAESTKIILGALNYQGYASIEYKRDPRDNSYKLIEITIARTWYPHYLGVAAGINIPYVWYSELCELDIQGQAKQKDGVRWVDEYRDIYSAIDYIRAKEHSWFSILKSYRPPIAFALFSFRDPLPFLSIIARLFLGAWRKLGRMLK